tara:strand:- start:532 stop:771 length:240 start_codon:yes stop_codon:yes gene_type:complete
MSNSDSTREWQKLYGDIVSEKVATKVTLPKKPLEFFAGRLPEGYLPKPPEYSRTSVLDDGWDNTFAGTENFSTYNPKKS